MMSISRQVSASRGFLRRTPRYLVAGVIVGAVVTACSPRSPDSEPRPDGSTESDIPRPGGVFAVPAQHQASLSDVAEGVIPSIVNIFTTRHIPEDLAPIEPPTEHPKSGMFPGELFVSPRQITHQSLGSGVIVSENGVILTNSHVVEHAREIRVMLSDGREFSAAIAGADPMSDLAVLRLQDEPDDLRPLPFGDSSALRIGELVMAVGNPFGVGQTVTMGIVSAKGRSRVGIVDYEDFIQTDAAVNPGNSGGALVNMRGELVGINTAILSRTGGSQGIGFAIPSSMARPIMESLLLYGLVRRGWLGIRTQPLDPELARGLDIPLERGVLVAHLDASGPAEKAGLERGDVILALAGEEIRTTERLRNRVATLTPGAQVELTILRRGERRTLTMTVATLPVELPAKARRPAPPDKPDGLRVAPLDERARTRFKIAQEATGVVVTKIAHASLAQESGLRVGDVIQEIDRVPIDSRATFERALAASGDTAVLLIWRDDSTRFLILRRP